MITDQTFQQEEAEIKVIFEEAGWLKRPVPNELRIHRIEERVLHEQISKESIDFIFTSFGSVLGSFTSAFFGHIPNSNQDYRV